MIFNRHLMGHINLFALSRRLQDAEADFKGRLSPATIVGDRAVIDDRLVQFSDLGGATGQTAGNGNFPALAVAVNNNAIGRLAHFAFFTAHDCQTEEFLMLDLERFTDQAGPAVT